MIDDRNFAEKTENLTGNKKKAVWKNIGIGALSFFLAVLTILVINVSLY